MVSANSVEETRKPFPSHLLPNSAQDIEGKEVI